MSLPRTQLLPSLVTSPLLHLPVLSAVLELDGARVLYAPGSKTTEAQLRDAGEITDIIAPSLTPTAGAPAALKVFPGARIWGPAGAREKHPELTWHGIFGVPRRAGAERRESEAARRVPRARALGVTVGSHSGLCRS